MWYNAPIALWENAKSAIFPHDDCLRSLVHVHGAIAVYLMLALLARRGLAACWPVVSVFAMTLASEVIDLLDLPDLSQVWVWQDSASDVFNSVVWPMGIMITARLAERNAAKIDLATQHDAHIGV